MVDDRPSVAPNERRQLLEVARTSLQTFLTSGRRVKPERGSGVLAEQRGAFVTLMRHGELRGCIGQVRGDRPLLDLIANMAIAAATDDPRFPPLTITELDEVDLEISVLSPPEPIAPGDVLVGTHGLIVRRLGRSGLLLPQVASDRNWDRLTFLQQTCRKAGLPIDDWQSQGAEILAFRAEVFSELDIDQKRAETTLNA